MDFLADDIAGAVDDLGTEVVLDDGTPFRGIFRSNFQDDNLGDAKVDTLKSSLMVGDELVARLQLHKGSGMTIEGYSCIVRRIEPTGGGFVRLVLTAR